MSDFQNAIVAIERAEAAHQKTQAENARLQARVKCFEDAGGVTMSTRIFTEMRLREEAEAALAAVREQRCETCRDSVEATSGVRYCVGPGHGVACEEFGHRCGAWARREP